MAVRVFVAGLRDAERRAGRRLYFLTPLPGEVLDLLQVWLCAQWWNRDLLVGRPRLRRCPQRRVRLPPTPGNEAAWFFPAWRDTPLFPQCSPWGHLLVTAETYTEARTGAVAARLHLVDVFARKVVASAHWAVGGLPRRADLALNGHGIYLGRDTVFAVMVGARAPLVYVSSWAVPSLEPLGERVMSTPEVGDELCVVGDALDRDDTVFLGTYVHLKTIFQARARFDRFLRPMQFNSAVDEEVPGTTLVRSTNARFHVGIRARLLPRRPDPSHRGAANYYGGISFLHRTSNSIERFDEENGNVGRGVVLWNARVPPGSSDSDIINARPNLFLMSSNDDLVSVMQYERRLTVGIGPPRGSDSHDGQVVREDVTASDQREDLVVASPVHGIATVSFASREYCISVYRPILF